MTIASPQPDADRIASWVRDARQRTFELVQDLSDDQLRVPLLEIVNPFLWEIGHVAWFQENFALLPVAGSPPLLEGAVELYDSSAVHHDTRWSLTLPSRERTREYMTAVRDAVLALLRERPLGERERSLLLLTIFHEDMHGEAFTYMRQTLGYPMPSLTGCEPSSAAPGPPAPRLEGDARVPGGTLVLGAARDAGFAFDNEQDAHPVEIAPFAISRTAVTQGELAAFADDGGYRTRALWCEEGWRWREAAGAEHPVYFLRGGDGSWKRRRFDREVPLEPDRPVVHVNWFEADAFCRWAGRRLPTEAEWEAAAACEPAPGGDRLSERKRRYPWGDAPPDPSRANLDSLALDTVDVSALPGGDSAFGCRQMLGNVWEWTQTVFEPYPGFRPGAYADYSAPWFGTRRVLRGGAWATRSRMVNNTYRNYFTPDRRDVFAGFRTCPAR